MLLKCCQTEKKMRTVGNTQKRSAGNSMRLTNTSQAGPRIQRKVVRTLAPKRTHRGVKEEPTVDPLCDNSNDSGLGFEQHQEHNAALRLADPDSVWGGERSGLGRVPDWSGGRQGWTGESSEAKRKRLEIKIESDDANDDFSFPDTVRKTTQLLLHSPPVERMSAPRPVKRPGLIAQRRSQTTLLSAQLLTKPPRGRVPGPQANRNILASHLLGLATKGRGKVAPGPTTNQACVVSRNGKTQLSIVCQPEQQHRARYQTEGSRGAVKDRTGNSFPQVQLTNWEGLATLEVYIGSDCGKVVPHMFYQACRVSGKNSTQCQERTEDGTVIIEVQFEPSKNMIVTCDCVGILKERNVDVEHRFPDHSASRNKKKSTRCCMVFRTILQHPDGSHETLQICSQPIACTQPPGVPEICKKSCTSSSACGGQELFILGKNFLKDTRVLLSNPDVEPPWEASVTPDKEYLQQSHLVCVIPPYHDPLISEPVAVRLTVVSSGKASEAHVFTYTPQSRVGSTDEERPPKQTEPSEPNPQVLVPSATFQTADVVTSTPGGTVLKPAPTMEPTPAETKKERVFPVMMWKSSVSSEDISKSMTLSLTSEEPVIRKELLLEPPALLPLLPRPTASEVKGHNKGVDLRTKLSSGSNLGAVPKAKIIMASGADLSSTLSPSMATLRRFVSKDNGSPLPSLSVENFLSRLECKPDGSPATLAKPGIKNPTALSAGLKVSASGLAVRPSATLAPSSSVLHLVGGAGRLVFRGGASLPPLTTPVASTPPLQGGPEDCPRRQQVPDQLKLRDLVTMAAHDRMMNTGSSPCSPPFKDDVVMQPQMIADPPPLEKHNGLVQTSEVGSFTKFGDENSTIVHCVPVAGNGINESRNTSPYNDYVSAQDSNVSLHSPPIENKEATAILSQQEPSLENHLRVTSTTCNGMFASQLPISTSIYHAEEGMASLPVISGNAQTLCNGHGVGSYSPPLAATGKTMLYQGAVPPQLEVYVQETPCTISCSPPVANKSILVHTKDQQLFDDQVTANLSHMTKDTSVVLDIHDVNRYTANGQLVMDSNVPIPSNEMLHDVSKTYRYVKSASSSPIAHADAPLLYSSMENHSSHSPPMNGGTAFVSTQMVSHELTSPPTSTSTATTPKLGGTLVAVGDYEVGVAEHLHLSRDPRTVAASLEGLHPLQCLSVDTRILGPTLIAGNRAQSPVLHHGLVHHSASPVGRTSPMVVDTSTLEQNMVINISSMGTTNLILYPSASVDTTSNISNHCTPSIALKNMILSSGVLGNDNTGHRVSPPVIKDMLLSSTAPREVGSHHSAQMAMKDMMLRVDVSSTMEDHLMSQPGAVTPETVRLDALVNSTLDRHIDAAHVPAPAPPCPPLEAASTGIATTNAPSGDVYPLGHGTCVVSGGLLQRVTCAASGVRYSPATEVSSSLEFKSVPTSMGFALDRPNVGFDLLTTDARFDVGSDSCFAPSSANPCDVLCAVSRGAGLAKAPEACTQKEAEQRKPEAVVRERREEGMVPQELTQMSDHDLISYINPSCFDQV